MSAFSRPARQVALVVAGANFMQLLDGVVIVTALPQMAREFGAEPLAVSAGITVYMLTAAIFVTMGAWLADRFGARRTFLAAIAIFTIASLACGLSRSLPQFILARAAQGIGGALMAPVGRMIVLRHADKSAIVEAIAMITWPGLIAPVIGPALGGFLTNYAAWQWNFYINLPLGAVAIAMILRLVPADTEFKAVPFDWIGFLLSAASMSALLWGLEAGVQNLLPSAVSAALGVLGLALGWAAALWLRGARHPLVSLKCFAVPTFAISNLTGGTGFRIAISATPFLLPLLFQIGFGLDPLQAGGFVVAYFLGNLLMKTVTTPILRARGFRGVLVVTGLLNTATLAGCALISPGFPYLLTIIILVAAGLVRSMQFTALTTLAFADIDASSRNSASTLSTMLQQIATVLGVIVAATALTLSRSARGAPELQLVDFQVAFLLLAAIALVSTWRMLRLAPDAGQEISGHRSARA